MADTGKILAHIALIYRNRAEYIAQVLSFVRAGIAAGEPVFLAVPGHNLSGISGIAESAGAAVTLADMTGLGRNPARLIPEIVAFCERHPGQRVRFVAEVIWPGRRAAEVREAIRYEAQLNEVLSGGQVSVMCPYDGTALEPAALTAAEHTHARLISGGQSRAGADPLWQGTLPPEYDLPLPPPPASAAMLEYLRQLGPVRGMVRSYGEHSGLTDDRVSDLVIAVNELAANTLAHTSGGGTLRVWLAGDELLCEVRDRGRIADPLAGRLRHDAEQRGHGLWLVNQVCDLVELRTGQAGTVIRVHMRLDRQV